VPEGQSDVVISATDPSGNLRTNTYQVTTAGETAAYDYHLSGDLKERIESGQAWTYEWNAEGQLAHVCLNVAPTPCTGANALASFAYDPLGRRVEKVATGVTHSYIYDGTDILQETVSDGTTTTTYRYIHGPGIDEPLAREEVGPGSLIYYHADGLGSIVKMTDQAGSVVHSYQYDTWGNIELGATQGGYAFTGREWDPEIGLYYYRARYYDPTLGRFVSEDPVGLVGGSLYAYVRNAPASLTDSRGLLPDPCPCENRKMCLGTARVVGGNKRHKGRPGGIPGRRVKVGTAALPPEQWDATDGRGLKPYADLICAVTPKPSGDRERVFDTVTDVMGSKQDRQKLMAANPGHMVVERAAGGKEADMGIIPIIFYIPKGMPCPKNTVEVDPYMDTLLRRPF
jgi:RHS repeat-associated protein